MSSIIIQDLARHRDLDKGALARVRGGFAMPSVNVNVNLDQKIGQFQNIQIGVLNNNGVIGAGFSAPSLSISPEQWAQNNAGIPAFA